MRNIKLMAHIYWHYLTCIRGMVFFILAGAFFLSFGILSLISTSGSQNGAYGFFIISLFLLLVFPFVTTGAVFRQLASNSQFALAKHAIQLAFFTLFISTLLVTFCPWLLLTLFGKSVMTGQVIWIFFGASLHLLITQLSLHRQAMQGYQFLPLLAIIFMHQIDVEKWSLLFIPVITWSILILTLGGWVWGFIKIFHIHRLNPNNFCSSLNLNSLDREALTRKAMSRWLQAKTSNQAGESVFYDMLMNNRVLETRQVLYIIVIPVFMAFFFLLLSGFDTDQDGPSILRLILLISILPATMSPFSLAEIMPRSKLLWLKTGNGRSDIWKLMEIYIVRELACTLVLTALLATIGLLSGAISVIETAAYMTLIICCAPFYAYYPLFFRLGTDMIKTILLISGLVTASIALFLVGIDTFYSGTSESVFVLSLVLLVLGIVFRFATRRTFLQVDWLKVKPRQLNFGRKALGKN